MTISHACHANLRLIKLWETKQNYAKPVILALVFIAINEKKFTLQMLRSLVLLFCLRKLFLFRIRINERIYLNVKKPNPISRSVLKTSERISPNSLFFSFLRKHFRLSSCDKNFFEGYCTALNRARSHFFSFLLCFSFFQQQKIHFCLFQMPIKCVFCSLS